MKENKKRKQFTEKADGHKKHKNRRSILIR